MVIFDIFRAKWKHSNPRVRLEAVEELEDQQTLTEIALKDDDSEVRGLAVKKLKDQQTFAEIALT